jgi:Uma2 family endonuclease
MDTLPPLMLSRAEFRAWAEQQPRGRFERVDGRVVPMTPERAGHILIKVAVATALRDALHAAKIAAQAFGDGMTVEIDANTDYEPDALVNLGPRLRIDAIAAPNPVIVVEVLSPGTQSVDTSEKLTGYLRVSSIQHYLIVSARRREVVHHRRVGEAFVSTVVTAGDILFDPPGISIAVDAIYRDVEL